MAIHGLDLTTTFKHVDENDPAKGTPEETIFYLHAIDSNVMGVIADRLTEYSVSTGGLTPSARMRLNEAATLAARFCIDRWENFKMANGESIACDKALEQIGGRSYQAITVECIGQIPLEVLTGIYRAARDQNELSEEEEKNSETAHSPSSSSPKESASVAPKNIKESGAAQKKQ